MTRIDLSTHGKPIRQGRSVVRRHPTLAVDVAYLHFSIGDVQLDFDFETGDEMIAFCEKHNFSYTDQRTGVEKYLARMEEAS